jgi:hypothetical protein
LLSIRGTSEGGYIATGFKDTKVYGQLARGVWVLKLDPLGNEEWETVENKSGDNSGYMVQETSDGGYIVAGQTLSFARPPKVSGLVLKLNGSGVVKWEKTFRGGKEGQHTISSIVQASDGNYVAVGSTYKGPRKPSGWILKLDSKGNMLWDKAYGSSMSRLQSICSTPDGGYVAAGKGRTGAWILKLDSEGNLNCK